MVVVAETIMTVATRRPRDDDNNDADTSIDTDGSWIGRDYRRVSRVMLFPCFSSTSLKGVLWSGLSHYEATV